MDKLTKYYIKFIPLSFNLNISDKKMEKHAKNITEVYNYVNHSLTFVEAKNGALVALNSGLIIGIFFTLVQIGADHPLWFILAFVPTLISLAASLASYYPLTQKKFVDPTEYVKEENINLFRCESIALPSKCLSDSNKKLQNKTVFIALFAMMMGLAHSHAQTSCPTALPLPASLRIDSAGCYNLDSLMTPLGTPSPPPTTIKIDIAKVDPAVDIHIGSNMTNPIWYGLPTGYTHPQGYDIYSPWVKPTMPGGYSLGGDQGVIRTFINFIATLEVREKKTPFGGVGDG
ncbi:MAG: hypothetical protein LBH92_08585 [Bacteroidales bacterium]|jgi:flagellar biosynthesis protein FliQ|nr:hypothetical protein [Bacteroidales bacterium]